MSPNSGFVRLYSSIPIAPGITAHSIIAVDNAEDPKEEWNDGVVAYSSAHIEGVASEFIVHSGHSTRKRPDHRGSAQNTPRKPEGTLTRKAGIKFEIRSSKQIQIGTGIALKGLKREPCSEL